MDAIIGAFQNMLWMAAIVTIFVIGLIGFFFYRTRYKIANGSQALVITGGKSKQDVKIIPNGGAFVSPLRKHQFFPLGVMTVRSNDQETQTKTLVPVVVQWTAQLKADVETPGALEKAVQGYSDFENEDGISGSLQQTLDGEVRAVVATMTPEQVVQDKDSFSTQVTEGVQKRMEELGFKLVSLNIAEVTDRNGHYRNLAAADRENRRMEAETLTAQADQAVAVERAKADEIAQGATLERDLKVAEKTREVTLRQAAIKVETDQAQADAAIAGELQTELRNQELAARRGEVTVVEEEQRQKAAVARREVEITDAETAKQRKQIEAEADAAKAKIDAEANATQARIKAEADATVKLQLSKGEAEAFAAEAEGQATAEVATAKGEADAINLRTEAKANSTRQQGLAEAEVATAKGKAEAEAILAKGEAEAEVQRKMAEALAAGDGANLKIRLAEIERDTVVTVQTNVGEAMARIGEKATFVDLGGNSSGGNVLADTLSSIPGLLAKLNVTSEALFDGKSFGQAIGSTVSEVKSQEE